LQALSTNRLTLRHNLRTISTRININGEKTRKLDTIAKLFQTMRNRPESQHDYRTT